MDINYVLRLLGRQEEQINRELTNVMQNLSESRDAFLFNTLQYAMAFSCHEKLKLIHTIKNYIEGKLEEEEHA